MAPTKAPRQRGDEHLSRPSQNSQPTQTFTSEPCPQTGISGCPATNSVPPEPTSTSASEPASMPTGNATGETISKFSTDLSQSFTTSGPSHTPSSMISAPQTDPSSSTEPASVPSSASSTPGSKKSSSHTGPIVGGVVGGLAGLALLALLVLFLRRRRRNRRASRGAPSSEFMYHPAVRARSGTPLVGGRLRPQRVDSDQEALYHAPQADGTLDISGGEQDLPPPFTTGSFRDPVLEKAEASSRYVDAMHARDAEMRQRDSL